uniref:Transposase Tc1-like domain-containing protein n=1 Tax=Tetradesmus obliquus TaxID=3088 RepID=A0A383VIC8_TETOB|eukprot:jgi/Sobl393_1/17638/SZX64136.1
MAKKRTFSDYAAKRHAALAALKAHKYDVDRAAKSLGYTRRYVKSQLDKYKERGDVWELPRSGRPKLLTDAQVEAVAELVLQHQCVAKAVAILKEQGMLASGISTVTVNRAVKNVLDLAPQQQQPILTSATKKRQQHDTDSIMAIDSTYLTLSSSQRRRKKWVRKGTKPVACKPVKGKQLHV